MTITYTAGTYGDSSITISDNRLGGRYRKPERTTRQHRIWAYLSSPRTETRPTRITPLLLHVLK